MSYRSYGAEYQALPYKGISILIPAELERALASWQWGTETFSADLGWKLISLVTVYLETSYMYIHGYIQLL